MHERVVDLVGDRAQELLTKIIGSNNLREETATKVEAILAKRKATNG